MILTITPNPSLDLLFTADDELRWDDANRMDAPRRRPGGQGINVTRAARALGGDSVAIALLGGATGSALAADLAAEGTPLRAVPIAGETRTFVAVRERSSGRSLLVNPRGPHCGAADAERLLAETRAALEALRPAWVVSSGSVPPGLDASLHREVGELARHARARFVADCDGEALHSAAHAGICELLVPNRFEAHRLAGTDPVDPPAAARIATGLLVHARTIIVKLGALGAVAATAEGIWHARPPDVPGGSTVGAGDAFLAALLLDLGRAASVRDALVAAVAAGTAALRSTGAGLVDPRAAAEVADATSVRRMGP